MRVSPCFLHAIAEGMHTMAQPLTVLRATLEIAAGNASCVSHFQRAVDTSLIEVSRVSEAMRFVQELLRIARDESPGSPVELSETIDIVCEDLGCVIESSGVRLFVERARDLPAVKASAKRLRQCLFYLIQHAAKTCRAGEAIRIAAQKAGETVQLTIRCEHLNDRYGVDEPHHELPWGGTMPCLVLAEGLLNADGGLLEWEAQPFSARLILPKAREDELALGVASSDSKNQRNVQPRSKSV